MYGLIGKMMAAPGQRDALIAILLESTNAMPGCLSYVVAKDVKDENAIWISEVWDSKDSHAASLTLPEVKAAQTPVKDARLLVTITKEEKVTASLPVRAAGPALRSPFWEEGFRRSS